MTRDEPQELAAAQQAAEAFAKGAIAVDHATSVDEADMPPRELAETSGERNSSSTIGMTVLAFAPSVSRSGTSAPGPRIEECSGRQGPRTRACDRAGGETPPGYSLTTA
jgi:hypothetical protein